MNFDLGAGYGNKKDYYILGIDRSLNVDPTIKEGDKINLVYSGKTERGPSLAKFENRDGGVQYILTSEDSSYTKNLYKVYAVLKEGECFIIDSVKYSLPHHSIVFLNEEDEIIGGELSVGDVFYINCDLISTGSPSYEYINEIYEISK